jgi:hypothetical protein
MHIKYGKEKSIPALLSHLDCRKNSTGYQRGNSPMSVAASSNKAGRSIYYPLRRKGIQGYYTFRCTGAAENGIVTGETGACIQRDKRGIHEVEMELPSGTSCLSSFAGNSAAPAKKTLTDTESRFPNTKEPEK